MQKDPEGQLVAIIPPAPKTSRGLLSTLDASLDYLLYFNGPTVILYPLNPQKVLLKVHHATDVSAVKFSLDGRMVVSIDEKGTLLSHQVAHNKLILLQTYHNFAIMVKSIDISADKKRVCVVGDGKNQFGRVASLETGVDTGSLTCICASLNSCSFRPERPYKLAVGGDELTVKFFEGPPYAFNKSNKAHLGYINQLKYSPKGTMFVSVGADRKIVVYNGTNAQTIIQKQNAHNGGIFGMDWIDEDHFVTCSSDKTIKIWNSKLDEKYTIETGSLEDMKNMKKVGLCLVAIKYSHNKIYAINLEGNILAYQNPLLDKTTNLVTTIAGVRSKPIQIIELTDTKFLILDLGGRILYNDIETNELFGLVNIEMKSISSGFIELCSSGCYKLSILTGEGNIILLQNIESHNYKEWKFIKEISHVEYKFIAAGTNDQIVAINNNQISLIGGSAGGHAELPAIGHGQLPVSVPVEEDPSFLTSYQGFIFSATVKGKLYAYDKQLQHIGKINLGTFKITVITIIPSNQQNIFYLMTGDALGHIKICKFTINTNNSYLFEPHNLTVGGHSSLVSSIAYNATDKLFYSFAMDAKIQYWSADMSNVKRICEDVQVCKFGILDGHVNKDYMVVCGGDLLVRVIKKKKVQ